MDDKKQAQMKQEIAAYMRKKDYYQILGVSKTCEQTEIKKAYKKLALRFHPDKNSVEGAKEVFKKVSNAYSILTNAQKRERYDRYGPQQHIAPPPRAYAYRQNGFDDPQFDQFEQMFRAFFGGGPVRFRNNNDQYYQSYTFNVGGQRHDSRQRAQPQGNNGFGFSYLFIIVIVIYLVGPLFKAKPYFSLTSSDDYRIKLHTQKLKAPYFVREGFIQEAQKQTSLKRTVDENVDRQYISQLNDECEKTSVLKKRIQYQAYKYQPGQIRTDLLNKAKEVDQTSCNKIHRIQQKFRDYVHALLYYY